MTLRLLPPSPDGGLTTYDTHMFGQLRTGDNQVLQFADGLLGFPSCKRWTLLEGARGGTSWLQSLDHMELAFLLVDPFIAFDGFAVDLGIADLRRLGAGPTSDLLVYAIATVPAATDRPVTANLHGPVVIDVHTRRGIQAVLAESAWGLREPVPATLIARGAAEDGRRADDGTKGWNTN